MADMVAQIEIPKRALFKAAEVCELVKVQSYVLRSWESEFPELGVARTPGGPRVYRRTDVEQVLRIKHLLLVDGLTLGGARRRLLEEVTPPAVDELLDDLVGRNAHERLAEVKRGLRAILDLLTGGRVGDDEFRLAPLGGGGGPRPVPAGDAEASRKVASRNGSSRGASRGKRSA
jgi:DNA-binding transcriptional MerR regulator